MSGRITPRIETEELPARRLEMAIDLPDPTPPRAPWGMPALTVAGMTVLIAGFSALAAGNFIAAEFARTAALGWVSLGVAVTGFGLIGAGFLREARALGALRGVDHIRADLLGPDPHRRLRAAEAGSGICPKRPTSSPLWTR